MAICIVFGKDSSSLLGFARLLGRKMPLLSNKLLKKNILCLYVLRVYRAMWC